MQGSQKYLQGDSIVLYQALFYPLKSRSGRFYRFFNRYLFFLSAIFALFAYSVLQFLPFAGRFMPVCLLQHECFHPDGRSLSAFRTNAWLLVFSMEVGTNRPNVIAVSHSTGPAVSVSISRERFCDTYGPKVRRVYAQYFNTNMGQQNQKY